MSLDGVRHTLKLIRLVNTDEKIVKALRKEMDIRFPVELS
jgi:hypothetical protein